MMRLLFPLIGRLLVTLARLARRGGVRSVVAESLAVKHQLLIARRSQRRAPNLTAWDRLLLGFYTLLVSPAYHEAGHTIATFVQGMGIRRVTIVPGEGSDGVTITHPVRMKSLDCEPISPRRATRIRNQTRCCLAGNIAQRRFNPRSVRSHHADSDRHDALDWA
jgi:hypothetical protein